MVIDDNVNILNGMQTLLFDWEPECLTAESHKDAIQSLQETAFVPELVIRPQGTQKITTEFHAIYALSSHSTVIIPLSRSRV